MPPDVVSEGNGSVAIERVQWNLAATLPPGCAACAQDLSAIYGFYSRAFPDSRGALLSYTKDAVLPVFYGITTAEFTTGLDEVLADQIAPTTNFRTFLVGAAGHELWFTPSLASSTVTVQQFVTQMVTDDASWASVQP